MIKNLIVNRSDLEALIRDYYECEERKGKNSGRLKDMEGSHSMNLWPNVGVTSRARRIIHISLGNGRPNTSSSKTQTDCLSMMTSVR